MSYDDDNSGGRGSYGRDQTGDSYGSSGRGGGGNDSYGSGNTYGSGRNDDSSYGNTVDPFNKSNTNTGDQGDRSYISGLGGDDDSSSNRNTGGYGGGTNTRGGDRDRLGNNPSSDDYGSNAISSTLDGRSQQTRSNDYDKPTPDRSGGGLAEDNAYDDARATGGAGSGRTQYGMGTGRTEDQEIGGFGGRSTRDDDNSYSGGTGTGTGTGASTGYGSSGLNNDDDDYNNNSSSGRGSNKQDSTAGKLMEKAGQMFGSDKLAQKGSQARRDAGGYGDDDTSTGRY